MARSSQFANDVSKSIPQIQRFMTTAPETISPTQTLKDAHVIMRERQIRHLPVVEGDRLVGLLTDRDLKLVQSLHGVDPAAVIAADVMASDVYTVKPDAALDEVVGEMASKKYGSAIVMQNGKVVGIFTTVDVCNAFAELLQSRLTR